MVLRLVREPSGEDDAGALPADHLRLLTPIPLPSWTGEDLADPMPSCLTAGSSSCRPGRPASSGLRSTPTALSLAATGRSCS